ncbi:conserved hypothetical protein [Nostocoides australiense Ben110]|uniref:OpcA protein n=1 Tax=Nostocoides australiense Ben110 TaxID=1193182 RepID=W6JZH0_9MICO|nr:glucose-6-phosphate dehydrogenase assembly protein OpcA [Tetrasphaera australiensis]MCB1300150.1 glucose-6-phosphate dehydrogenase assembly protein OpcA [Tetrasphaera sp.]CCH74597.1 conserved hypothetical protein [Tetrasphaera australiensis Ben110]HRW02820.1 glucose-6-phosphate dehydrogenase assembly protein OpcA [Tetrasphaera sp.]
MIVDLPSTTTANISKKLIALRQDVGAMALSRVLTLVVVTDEQGADAAIDTANTASRQHPSRIIVVITANKRGAARLDAQIRVGGDAGASEVVVIRLYGPLAAHGRSVVTPLLLADSPIVVWWPGEPPKDPGADPIGAMAQRRVTDSAKSAAKPKAVLGRLAAAYTDGDTDLAWSRITLWRGLLAAALDQAPYEPVTEALVVAAPDSPSGDLLAGWLAAYLKCPVALVRGAHRSGIISVRLTRKSSTIDLVRPQEGNVATAIQTGQPERTIALAHRKDAECLADELRRLDSDEVYEEALRRGIPKITAKTMTAGAAVRSGLAVSEKEAMEIANRVHRKNRLGKAASMVTELPDASDDEQRVKVAAAEKLAASTKTDLEPPSEPTSRAGRAATKR